ncbi:ATP-binding protein [Tundrisphaera lichenicola]|uniref:PAS domain-containing hybrid sensor histidine kinase/response regulator n=1 Tax=Tundrisphaera lichenicola TaxID=2029860 RepID=UPI003EB9B389
MTARRPQTGGLEGQSPISDLEFGIRRSFGTHGMADPFDTQANGWLAAVLKSIADGVIATDADARVAFMNRVAEQLTGWTQAEARSKPVADVLRLVDERTGRREAWPVREALAAGRPVSIPESTVLLSRTGQRFNLNDVASPVYDERGELTGAVIVFHDATERRQAEDRFRDIEGEAQRQLNELVEQCPFGIYIIDADFRIAMMNRWSQEGAFVNVRPVIGRPFDEAIRILWSEPVAVDIIRTFRHTLDSGEPYTSKDFVKPRADEDRVDGYEWELHRITLPDGRPGVVCYYFDVTRLREAEAALRENDRRKDEFLAMLAHELRNPLSAIGNAVNVTKRSGLQEHVEWSMEVIDRQMSHLTRLIEDLMDVSRINRGKIELRRDVMDVTPILDSAAATVRPLAEERKHTLEVAIDRKNLWANVDPTRLEQVVVNLLNNAAKYSENTGHVLLSAETQGDELVIAVRDNGVGIPPEKLPQMFELFAQGDRSLARSEGGLGIGLTVVKKLVEMHGGSITAASNGLGKGSEFTIRLPAAKRPVVTRQEAASAEEGKTKKARILVVDDNVDTARGMARLLKLLGHDVAVAHCGHEAIEVAREYRPEFVLLDIGLPGMDGYEVASRMRQEERCRHAVIVAVSGYGQDEDRRRSKEAGFDHHLIKPIDHDALRSLLSADRNGQG